MELTFPIKPLQDLIQPLGLKAYNVGSQEISHLSQDSRDVQKGSLFFARRGLSHTGTSFIHDAIKKGAVAVCHSAYDPTLPKELAQVVAPDIDQVMGEIASLFYGEPSKSLVCIGVTGTSGKTTVTYLVHQMLLALGKKSSVIGTTGILFEGRRTPSKLTTLDAITLQKELYKLKMRGCEYVSLEVSSHALDQKRAYGLYFQSRIYTNLSPEHLDYHKTMECYAEAKAKLFRLPLERASPSMIANADDAYQLTICPRPSLTYGIKSGSLKAKGVELLAQGSRFLLTHPKFESKEIELPLTGKFNIYNFLAAFGALLDLGFAFNELCRVASSLKSPPGRLQPVDSNAPFDVYIDYAHKPDALKHALKALKASTKGRLLLVFGCGGDRDREKRPLMGKIASELADRVWITNDNPRFEDPHSIAQQITTGFEKGAQFDVVLDRKEAISKALHAAEPLDCILIAGRGHEEYQLVEGKEIPFNDLKVSQKILDDLQTPAMRFES